MIVGIIVGFLVISIISSFFIVKCIWFVSIIGGFVILFVKCFKLCGYVIGNFEIF